MCRTYQYLPGKPAIYSPFFRVENHPTLSVEWSFHLSHRDGHLNVEQASQRRSCPNPLPYTSRRSTAEAIDANDKKHLYFFARAP